MLRNLLRNLWQRLIHRRTTPRLDRTGPATIYARPGGSPDKAAAAWRNQPTARYRECVDMRADYFGRRQ